MKSPGGVLLSALMLFVGCSPPRPEIAESVSRQQIEAQSEGHIRLIAFRKTDGQKFEINGMQGYNLEYEAEITFDRDGSWLTGGPSQVEFRFSDAPASHDSVARLINMAVDGGRDVRKGEHVKIAGVMVGTKKESGWKFELGESRIPGAPERTATRQTDTEDAEHDRNVCLNNLNQLYWAKQQWALEKNKTSEDVPTASDILPCYGAGMEKQLPKCPSGGDYSLNAVDQPVTCTVPGHVLRR